MLFIADSTNRVKIYEKFEHKIDISTNSSIHQIIDCGDNILCLSSDTAVEYNIDKKEEDTSTKGLIKALQTKELIKNSTLSTHNTSLTYSNSQRRDRANSEHSEGHNVLNSNHSLHRHAGHPLKDRDKDLNSSNFDKSVSSLLASNGLLNNTTSNFEDEGFDDSVDISKYKINTFYINSACTMNRNDEFVNNSGSSLGAIEKSNVLG